MLDVDYFYLHGNIFYKKCFQREKSVYICSMVTEQEILEKTFKLFCRYGIKSLTMSDIASNLHISKKTLYKYVSDKHDLVKKVFWDLEHHHKFINTFQLNGNAIEQFYQVSRKVMEMIKQTNMHMLFDLKKYYPDVYEEIQVRRQKAIVKNVSENIKAGQKDGLYRKEINPELVGELYFLKTNALIDSDFVNSGKYTLKEIFVELFKYHILGICTEKGRKFLENFKIFEDDEV